VPGKGDNRGVGELPAGTVTMLFSDIEGSTALLGRLGERYGEALSAHHALLRAAFAAWRGREMSTEGDSFFVVFGSAGDAVGCALAAQRALAGYDWPAGEAVRVRIGLHSGEPAEHEGNYIGMDVHRAARIAAAAHGGQVVLSEAVRVLAEPRLPDGVSVRDLGFHRLKDIAEPERIYQLAGPGLAGDFAPLKSLGAQTSLPVPATPLVGRAEDLARLRAAVSGPGVRLVTLTGAGGVGKTRLALAAAAALDRAFPHGVFFVALAAVTDAEVMWKTLAGSLDVRVEGRAADAVTGYLAGRRALLVLDNLEQLAGAAGVVAGLLAAASGLVVLATSRGPLHVQGEHEFPVSPLELPAGAGLEAVAASDAARLFAQQAGLVRPGFAITADNAADVAAICARLDGLPLAIELAAARVRLLAPRAVLARLGHSLGLGAAEAGRPLRQQTLRNTIAWSYELLAPELAQVFRRMSVFAGGCDLDALTAVAVTEDGAAAGSDPLELVAELADVSLITVTEGEGGEPRLGMLETIRQYAVERLEHDDDLDGARRRHAGYYAAFAEQATPQLGGPEHLAWLDRLEVEQDNLRAALSWSLGPGTAGPAGDGERTATGLRLARALGDYWYRYGHMPEGRRWLERAIDLSPADAGAPLARLTSWLGVLLERQGELEAAVRLFERSLAIAREVGDRHRQAGALNSLGITHANLGHLDTARALLEESIVIAREIGSDRLLDIALANLGELEGRAGNLDRAAQLLHEALTLEQKRGDAWAAVIAQLSLGEVSLRGGRIREASQMLSATFGWLAGSGDTPNLIAAIELSACITAELGDGMRAARLAGAAEALRQQAGMPLQQSDLDLLERFLAPARATIARAAWDAELAAGRALTQQEAVTLLLTPSPADQMPA
jgi:predicted ATPase/class 3 adenylate cyclase